MIRSRFPGVVRLTGRTTWEAREERHGESRTISDGHESEEAAAAECDLADIRRYGILRAYPRLRLPQVHEASHRAAQAEEQARIADLARHAEEALLSKPFPKESDSDLFQGWLRGESVRALSSIYFTHETVTRTRLQELVRSRFAAIGLEVRNLQEAAPESDRTPAVSKKKVFGFR